MGVPVGDDEFVNSHGRALGHQHQEFLESLLRLPFVQHSWLLLLFCAVPRANHLLRTVSPTQVTEFATAHDARVLHCFERLLGLTPGAETEQSHEISRDLWVRQVRLPFRFGGCGLRSSLRTAPAAHWASWADALPVLRVRFAAITEAACGAMDAASTAESIARLPQSLGDAVAAGRGLDEVGFRSRPSWHELSRGSLPPASEPNEQPGPDDVPHGWQFHASSILEQIEHTSLLHAMVGTVSRGARRSPLPARARLRSCAGPFAGSWLSAVPASPALRMSNPEMLCAVRRRLGMRVDPLGERCEGCGRQVDAHGHHRAACTRTARTCARHRTIVAAWRQVFQEAGGQVPDRNVERMLRDTHVPVPPADARRLDLVVPGLSVHRGLPLFCDATCVTPIAGSGVARSGATRGDGATVRRAHRKNQTDYPEVEQSGLGKLLCLGVEVFGRWGPDPIELVPALAWERARGLPERVRHGAAQALSRRWWGLLSTAVQRAVAAGVLRRAGGDVGESALEPPPGLADLPV